ncbi:glycosyltransferase [Nitrospinae bacterium AH_259_B05_G02_I21]|nr:glycosyltransferase [Nitrospinae bacterium AH_259_B05_G02_I21]
MTLLFVTVDHPPLPGGMATYSSELARHLAQREECIVLASRVPGWRAFDARQPFKTVRVPNTLGLRELSFAIVIVYFIIKFPIRALVTTQWFPCGLVTYLVTRLLRRPYYLAAHGSEFLDDTNTLRRRLKGYLRWGKMATFRGAKRVIAISRYTKERLVSMGVPSKRIEVINTGVNAERFRPDIDPAAVRQHLGIEGRRMLLTVARLEARKGIDTVIQALPTVRERFPDVLYLVVGKGEERPALERLVEELGLTEFVRFAGHVSDGDLPAAYNACDLFVMLSRAHTDRASIEGFGIVFLEAAACGKASIGGRSGGVPDAVVDGKTGLVVDPLNIDAIAEAIIHLLAHPEEAERMGRQGRERVLAELQWPIVARNIHALTLKEDDPAKKSPSSKPCKIAHIITRLDRGGSSDNTLLTVLGHDPSKYRVTLISGLTTFPSTLVGRLADRPDITIRFLPNLTRAMHPLKDLQALWDLYMACRREGFDLVHTHSSKAGILGRWAAWLAGCRRLVHTPHGHVFTGYYGPVLSRLFVYAERLTAPITDTIITLTPRGIEDHLAWRIAPEEKFTAVPSGVELEGFAPPSPADGGSSVRAALSLHPDEPIVGSVGRLDRVKGYDQLVEASDLVLRERPDAWFVVAGDGQERGALEAQARRLGVAGRWRFLGWQERLEPLYHAFDISVLPSRNEGMGRAVVEALACGRPVVATAVGGVPSVVEDGVTGLLVPPEDPHALARAILQLLEDETARRRMGEAGPKWVRERFSCQAMLDGIERVYSRLLNDSPGEVKL